MRKVTGLFAALALGLLASSAGAGQTTIKMAVLTDMSGPYSGITGEGSVVAAQLAVEDAGGKAAGRKIEIVFGDHFNKPDVGLTLARRWYDVDGVDVIVDVANSAIALAVSILSAEKRKLVLYASPGSERLTEDSCTAFSMKWGSDSYSQTNGGVKSAIASGANTWFILAKDDAFGNAARDEIRKAVVDNGGTVVGSVRFPVNTLDFSSFLLQAQASRAKMISLIAGGSDTVNAMKQANEFGILGSAQKMSSPNVYINDVHGAGLKQMSGMQVVVPFYWDYDDRTRAFAKRFYERRGNMPSELQASVYGSVLDYLHAVEAAGTDDPVAVTAMLKKMKLDTAFTRNGRVQDNGRVTHDMYLVEVKRPDESTKPWDYYKIIATIPADQAFRPVSESKCPLLKRVN